jgi:tetratricopeptide (TPR) repeat protein
MPSIIEGYNYDIFISYRQKDNKGDKWVSKFVEALKTELEATFKEDVSVYFDENPHDRLQETYNVNKSLEGKLKCLIFIPILSQTYCDFKCYAWQYEFLTFLRMAEQDCFGKDIKLRSGNVASRILPIRIHDLEQEDIKLFEKETGSVLRAMDFVFKTASGVNRPLKPNEDHPQDNLDKTFYSDQINKVAHAIKEIILGMKTESGELGKEKVLHSEALEGIKKEGRTDTPEKSAKLSSQKIVSGIIIIAILAIMAVLVFPKVFQLGKNKVAKDTDGRISIAVNNFNNISTDSTLGNLEIAIPDILRNDLANSKELQVQNTQTMNELYQSMGQEQKASIIPAISREAAMKLKASTFVAGSLQRIGDTILILAELNDTKSGEILWSGNVKGISYKYPYLTISLSEQLKNFLKIKILKQKARPEYSDANTKSSDAYLKYIEGMNSLMKTDYNSAVSSFKDAFRIDTTFTLAAFYAAYANDLLNTIVPGDIRHQTALWTIKAYNGRERLPENYKPWLMMWYAFWITKNSNDVMYFCSLLEKSDLKSRYLLSDLANTYMIFGKNDEALKLFEKIEQINLEWGEDWKFKSFYVQFGQRYHDASRHDKEAKIYQTGLRIFPDDKDILWRQTVCALATGDTAKATTLIDKQLKIEKEDGWAASRNENWLGNLYWQANIYDEAEKHFRLSMQLDTNYDYADYNLANMFIFKDIKVKEGLEILDKLAKKYPKNLDFFYYFKRGTSLFKLGRYSEADSLLKNLKDTCISVNPDLDKLIIQVKDALAREK